MKCPALVRLNFVFGSAVLKGEVIFCFFFLSGHVSQNLSGWNRVGLSITEVTNIYVLLVNPWEGHPEGGLGKIYIFGRFAQGVFVLGLLPLGCILCTGVAVWAAACAWLRA